MIIAAIGFGIAASILPIWQARITARKIALRPRKRKAVDLVYLKPVAA